MLKRTTIACATLAVVISSSATFAMGEPKSNQFWWPDQVDLTPLRQHSPESNPMGASFDYAAAFAELDLDEITTARVVNRVLSDQRKLGPKTATAWEMTHALVQ